MLKVQVRPQRARWGKLCMAFRLDLLTYFFHLELTEQTIIQGFKNIGGVWRQTDNDDSMVHRCLQSIVGEEAVSTCSINTLRNQELKMWSIIHPDSKHPYADPSKML